MSKKNNKLIIKKIVFAIIVITVCVGCFLLIKPYFPHKYGTTTGNIINGQGLVELGDEVYFFGASDDKKGLFKIDKKGRAVHISHQMGIRLNGIGDYLYFRTLKGAGEKDQIIKIKKDGSESQILIEGELGSELAVIDNTVYFAYTPEDEKSENIYRMSTNGNFIRKTGVSPYDKFQLLFCPLIRINKFKDLKCVNGLLQIKDKYIYFALIPDEDEPKIYDLYRTTGGEKENELLVNGITSYHMAEDGYLYYAQLNKKAGTVSISKMDIETREHEPLAEIDSHGERVLSLAIAADKIHIGIHRTAYYLLNTDGTNLIKVANFLNK